jgi:O-antigen/teichoic acid export membrane protein
LNFLNVNNREKLFVKNFALQALNALFSFVFVILAAIYLGPEKRGFINVVNNYNGILLLLLGFGFSSIVVHLANSKSHSLDKIFYFGLLLTVFSSAIYLISAIIYFNNQLEYQGTYILQLVLFFCIFFNSINSQILVSQNCFFRQNAALLLGNFISILILLILISSSFSGQLFVGLLLMILVQIVPLFLNLYYIFKKNIVSQINIFDFKTVKTFLNYSLIGYVGNLVQVIVYKADVLVLKNIVENEELGKFGLAVSLAQFIWLLPTSMASIIYSKTSKLDLSFDVIKEFTKSLKYLFFAQISICLSFLIILNFLSSNELLSPYKNSQNYFINSLPGVFFFSFSIVLGSFFAGLGRQKINTRGAIIGFIFYIISIYPLSSIYGINGAIFCTTCAYVLNTVFLFFNFTKIYNKTIINYEQV